MKTPTYATIALGSLRHRRAQYASLALGVLLAICFATTTLLAAQSVYETSRLRHVRRRGAQDVIVLDACVTPERLIEDGVATRVGVVRVIGQTESGLSIGCYDETASEMLARACVEGRLPEKDGELAVERSKLERMGAEASVGGEITLRYFVPTSATSFLPEAREKTYTLVGLLEEQTSYQEGETWGASQNCAHMPGLVVWSGAQVEAGGVNVYNLLAETRAWLTRDMLNEYFWSVDCYGVEHTRFQRLGADSQSVTLFAIAVLGAVLLLSACMGIVNAFSATMSERRAEIGMLRAVGATRRQIRRMFGSEALLLALTLAPLGILLSVLLVWGASLALGDAFTFHMKPWFLPVDALVSVAVVLLAASVPIRRAARVSPMQAIRDTALLRAKHRARVKPKRFFRVPELLAKRHLTLYKTGRIGVSVMVALSVLILSIGYYALPLYISFLRQIRGGWDYELESGYWVAEGELVEGNVGKALFTDGDLREAESLPLVKSVTTRRVAQANWVLPETTEYLLGSADCVSTTFLMTEEEALAFYSQEAYAPQLERCMDWWRSDRARYEALRQALNTRDTLYPAVICAVAEDTVARLAPYVTEGAIDLAALNSGREVLVVTAQRYAVERRFTYDEQGGNSGSLALLTDKDLGENYARGRVYVNDVFRAGETLPLMRLYALGAYDPYENEDAPLEGVTREDASVTIGALLSTDFLGVEGIADIVMMRGGMGSVITTVAGLNSLGFATAGYDGMTIALSETPDADTEAYLDQSLEWIGDRVEGARLRSRLAITRENRNTALVMTACFAAVLGLLFAVCVSMINNAITGRLRGDRRSIGTLRAVGAPLPAILASYTRETAMLLGWGLAGGLALSAGFFLTLYIVAYPVFPVEWPLAYLIPVATAFAGLLLGCCGLNLRARLREITKSSIVENIREL